jgi:hypothetical protein
MALEELVNDFKVAAVDPMRQADSTALYNQIRQACHPIVQGVNSKYRNLRNFVEDIADEKLHDCLRTFKSGLFEGYYRRSLSNAASSESRRRKKLPSPELVEQAEKRASVPRDQGGPEFLEIINLYAVRKRKLIDQLSEGLGARTATLLLDQRCRMSRKTATLLHDNDLGNPSSCIEKWELWHADDELRFCHDNQPPSIQDVWECFAEKLNSSPTEVSHGSMVDAIEKAGGSVTLQTWRQRVSRYLSFVEQQVSEPEWKLFHGKD